MVTMPKAVGLERITPQYIFQCMLERTDAITNEVLGTITFMLASPLYIYIYIYIYTHTHTHTYIYIYIYIYICASVCVVPFSVCDGTGSKEERNTYLTLILLTWKIW